MWVLSVALALAQARGARERPGWGRPQAPPGHGTLGKSFEPSATFSVREVHGWSLSAVTSALRWLGGQGRGSSPATNTGVAHVVMSLLSTAARVAPRVALR